MSGVCCHVCASSTRSCAFLYCMVLYRVQQYSTISHLLFPLQSVYRLNSSLCMLAVVMCSLVQSLSHVQLFATPWTTAHQASLSITNSQRLPKLMSIESVMPSNHIILCCPLLLLLSIFPSIRSFQMSQLFTSCGQSTGASASISVLPINTQDWSPLGWTGWISLQSKGLSRVFSNTTVFSVQLSL